MPGIIEVPLNPAWVEDVPLLLETDLALGAETQDDQDGDLNLQAIALAVRTEFLKNEIDDIKSQIPDFVTGDALSGLDITLLSLQEKTQTVTIASGETTKNINLNNGAIVFLNCGNSNACTLTFSNQRARLSGLLIFTCNAGQDREIVLPNSWAVGEISRTLLLRDSKSNSLPFEYVVLTNTTAVPPTQEFVLGGSLSPNLLMPV